MMNQNYMRLVHSMNRTSAWENLKSIFFDGVDEYTDLGRVTMTEGATYFSLSFWAKVPDNTTSTLSYLLGRYLNGSNGLYCQKNGVSGQRDNQFGFSVGNGTVTSSMSVSGSWDNVWTHWVYVFDGTQTGNAKAKIYQNGSLATVTWRSPTTFTLTSIDSDTTSMALGAIGGITSENMEGQLDEVGFFDYSLSASEVTAIYNSGCPNDLMSLAAAKRPEHYYRFDDVTYPTVDDLGETGGNDGTMTNQESTDLAINSPCGFNNYSLAFDGVDEFTTMGTMSDLDNLTEASYSFWVKRDSATTVFPLGYFTAGTSPHMYCAINSGGEVLLQMYGTGGLKAAVTTTPIAIIIGGWYHIALVYDAALTPMTAALSIFVNGTKLTVTQTAGTTGIPTDLGTTSAFKLAEVGSNWFDGGLDEVAVFDYALTSTNVTDIYNSRVIIDLSTISGLTNPIHWYRCGDNDTYPTISDVGSNPVNDGTMTNMESGDINGSVPL